MRSPRLLRRLALPGIAALSAGICGGGWLGLLAITFGLFILYCLCLDSLENPKRASHAKEKYGTFRLIGPFASRELVRAGRGSRRQFWRVIYVLVTLGALTLFHLENYRESHHDLSINQLRRLTQINESFFYLYAIMLLVVTSILTMNWASELILEERHARRWDILRTTQLTSREIIVGKAVGRLPVVLDPFVATLPVLAMMTLMGGFSPIMLYLVVVATLVTAFGLGGLTLFYATFAKKPGQANSAASGMTILYLIASGSMSIAIAAPWFPSILVNPIWLVQSGNPFVIVSQSAAGGLDETLLGELPRYAAFHIFIGLLFGMVAIVRLRTATPWDMETATKKILGRVKGRPGWSIDRPPVGDDPVTWWEQFGHLNTVQMATWRVAKHWINVWMVGLFLFLGYLIQFWIGQFQLDPHQKAGEIVGVIVWIFSWPPIMGAMFRGAKSIARERAGDTLEMLLTTDLTPNDILYQKWKGVVTGEKPAACLGLSLLIAATICGFVPIVGAIAFACSVVLMTMAAGAVGLAFSASADKPEKAMRKLMFILIPGTFCASVFVWPPFIAGMVLMMSYSQDRDVGKTLILWAALGLGGWMIAGIAAWGIARKSFAKWANGTETK